MMKSPFRYILYLLIGVMLYFYIGADENPEALDSVHRSAPVIIITIVVLLFVVRYFRARQDSNRKE